MINKLYKLFIGLSMFILLNACAWLEPACKLTESDKEWVVHAN